MELTNNSTDFIKGALLGSLIGGAAGLLFAPKPGKQMREDIANVYEKGHDYAESLKEKGKEAYQKLKPGSDSSSDHETFLIGGALGGVIGVVAALLLAPQSGKDLREAFGEKYDQIRDKAEDFASDVKEKGSETLHEVGDKFSEWKEIFKTVVDKIGSKSTGHSSLEELAEWANIGLRMIKQAGR